jgi:hypothetical protein
VDDLVAKGEEDELREPVVGREVQAFKVLAAEGVVPVAAQSVRVDWTDPVFRQATHLRVDSRGNVVRREVLMESAAPLEGEGEATAPARPESLPLPSDPETLRALADLEDQRRSGQITEQEYRDARRELLREAAPAP